MIAHAGLSARSQTAEAIRADVLDLAFAARPAHAAWH
jgi:hypothetical protein